MNTKKNENDLYVAKQDNPKKVMYFAKESLCTSNEINIIATTNSAGVAARAAEILSRLNYVKIENIQTLTTVENGKRKSLLIITLKKSEIFEKLYKEGKELKEKQKIEREKIEKEKVNNEDK